MISELSNIFRKNRKKVFINFCDSYVKPVRILDFGGTAKFWDFWFQDDVDDFEVTLVNNHHIDKTCSEYKSTKKWIKDVRKDIREVLATIKKEEYSLLFSNSFFEHLESYEVQKEVAKQVEDSNLPYFMQVPNKHFIVDPHFPSIFVPFFACYPKVLQERLLLIDKFGSGSKANSIKEVKKRFKYYNPIGVRELREMFPSGVLHKERILGFAKSLIIMKK